MLYFFRFALDHNLMYAKLVGQGTLRPRICVKYFLSFPQKNLVQRKLRQTKYLLFNFWMIKETKTLILPNFQVPSCFFCWGEYNVENLKLIRRHHKNVKTHLKGKKIYLFFKNKKACSEKDTFFSPFFNGFHSGTLVQVIGNKSTDLGFFFSQIRFGSVWS